MIYHIGDLEVTVLRKSMKNMYLYVKPPEGRIEIHAPKRVAKQEIVDFVLRKESWIRQKQKQVREKSYHSMRKYETGEILPIWGEKVCLQVFVGKTRKVRREGDFLYLTCREDDGQEVREKILREWYRSELKERIQERLPRIEEYTGFHASSWQTKWMKTRWGTCNTGTHKIWLNVRLAEKPPVCLDYVLLHELVHTKVPNHGPEFYREMDRWLPGWKDIRKRLNQ